MSQRGLPPRNRSAKTTSTKTPTKTTGRKSRPASQPNSTQGPLLIIGGTATIILVLGVAYFLISSLGSKSEISPNTAVADKANPGTDTSEVALPKEGTANEIVAPPQSPTYQDILTDHTAFAKQTAIWLLALTPDISSDEFLSKLKEYDQKMLSLERRAVLVPPVNEAEFFAALDRQQEQAQKEVVATGKDLEKRISALPEDKQSELYRFRERTQVCMAVLTVALTEPSAPKSPDDEFCRKYLVDSRKPWADFARAIESGPTSQTIPAIEELIKLTDATMASLPPGELRKPDRAVMVNQLRSIKNYFQREWKNLGQGKDSDALVTPIFNLVEKTKEFANRLEIP